MVCTRPVANIDPRTLVLADGGILQATALILDTSLVGTVLVEGGRILGVGGGNEGQQHTSGEDNFFHGERWG